MVIIAGLLFILFRILFLTSLPIFNDEAMYLHWGNDFLRFWSDPAMPLSLQGKQALTAISLGLVQRLPIDPLIAGRMVTILFSCVTFFGIAWTAKKLVSKKTTYVTLILLSASPLLLFFDRLATPDGIVAAIYTMAMALTVALMGKPNIRIAITLGIVIALGWWYKSTVLLAIPAIIGTNIFGNRKKELQKITIIFGSIAISIGLLLSVGLINIPVLNRVAPLTETEHVFTMRQLIRFPWGQWIQNSTKVLEAVIIMGPPIGLILLPWSRKKNVSIVWIWFLVPILSELFLARIFYLRYLILSVPPFCILLATALGSLPKGRRVLTAITIGTSLILSTILIARPIMFYQILSPLQKIQEDIGQYVLGWSSGWGVKEAADMLARKGANRPTVVFVRADSGNPEDGMYVYLYKVKQIHVVPVSYINQIVTSTKDITGIQYFFVSRGEQFAGLENRLTEIKRFYKPLDREFVGVYTYTP